MIKMKKLNKIKVFEGKLVCVTGLHIGGGDNGMHIGGTDNPVIKKVGAVSEPYIPGSSLKGKIRSLLEIYKGEEFDSELALLFGKKAEDNKNQQVPSRLSFWDCSLSESWKKTITDNDLPFTEVKMENTINRKSGTAKHPRNTERVVAGAEFDFKLSVKVFENENYDDLILKGLKLLEHDSLGGSGSRGYGKVSFKNLTVDGVSVQEKFDAIHLF